MSDDERQAAETLLDVFEEMTESIDASLRKLEQAGQLFENVQAAFIECGTLLDEPARHMAQMLQEFPALCGQLEIAVEGLATPLLDCQRRLEEMTAVAHESLDEVTSQHRIAQETAEAARAEMQEQADDIIGQMDELIEATQESIEEIIATMVDSLSENLLNPVGEFREECITRINALVEEVVDDILPNKTNEVTQEWLEDLREELAGMIEMIQERCAEFRETIHQGTDRAGSTRATSEAAMELLRTAFAPITNELDRVRSLAGMVGISI